MISVKGVVCGKCGDFIYSRAQHDYHSCSCGQTSVDGGFDYLRILTRLEKQPTVIERKVKATKKQLYDDWNEGGEKYGFIKKGKVYKASKA